jgi:Cytochrome c7 and related cytochrome c/Class III cytochrome C family
MSPRPTARRAALAETPGPLAWLPALLLAGACSAEVRQPVGYNHQVHVKKLELACDTCHETSRSGEAAGLPPLSTCAACHQEPNGPSPEELKVVAAVQADRPIGWVRLYQVPRHVYFTHRRHVAVAGIACERCHGDMGSQVRPPPGPLVALTMDACLLCHRQMGASIDCGACHR